MNKIRLILFSVLLTYSFGSLADEVTHRYLAPESVASALGQYSHGVETPENVYWVHVAGQTGIRKDGSIPKDFETQARIIMANIKAILAEGGMAWSDVVSYNVYMTHREDLDVWRTLAPELLAGAKPAGTLVFVSGLVHPDWRMEMEVRAARSR